MLRFALFFLVLAVIAGVLGFTTVVGVAIAGAKMVAYICAVLFVVFVVMHLAGGKAPRKTTTR